MDEPRVTFLMPVRNGMPWLPATLSSIEAQTYRNFEILVWDNGSSDGTVEELNRWIPHRIPGRVITGKPLSLGESSAALIETATTELCARIDSDDVNLSRRLEKQVAFMVNHPKVGVLATRCEYIDENGERRPSYEFPIDDAAIRWQLRWRGAVFHSSVLCRRSVALKAGNYRNFAIGEDYDLFFRIARLAEIRSLPEILLLIRKHGRNMTAKITDYSPWFDEIAVSNAAILFEGLMPEHSLDLRAKVSEVWLDESPVTVADLYRLSRAALKTARAAGKPADYFKRTELYRLQRNSIARRLLAQQAVGRALLRLKRATMKQPAGTDGFRV